MRVLGLDRFAAIGVLHLFWWWSMDWAEEGDLSAYSDEDLADAAPPPSDLTVPAELTTFDATLRGLPGYVPTAALFARIVAKYGALDLDEEALKIASWLRDPKQRKAQRLCSAGFLVTWLGKAL